MVTLVDYCAKECMCTIVLYCEYYSLTIWYIYLCNLVFKVQCKLLIKTISHQRFL